MRGSRKGFFSFFPLYFLVEENNQNQSIENFRRISICCGSQIPITASVGGKNEKEKSKEFSRNAQIKTTKLFWTEKYGHFLPANGAKLKLIQVVRAMSAPNRYHDRIHRNDWNKYNNIIFPNNCIIMSYH